MKILYDTKIATRTMIGFGVVFTLMIALTAISVIQVNRINSKLTTMNSFNSVKQRYAINFRGSVHDRAIRVRDVTLVTPDERQAVLADITRLEGFYLLSETAMDGMFSARPDITQEERDVMGEIKAAQAAALPLVKAVAAAQLSDHPDQARLLLMGQARPAFIDWLRAINKFIDLEEHKNQVIAAQVRSITQSFEFLMLGLCGIALVVGAAFAWWNISALRRLSVLDGKMLLLARGDLNVTLPADTGNDEVARMIRTIKTFKASMVESVHLAAEKMGDVAARSQRQSAMERDTEAFGTSMTTVLAKLTGSADTMRGAAEAMTSASAAVHHEATSTSAGAEKSSHDLNSTAAAVEELTASFTEIARQVSTAAASSREAVQKAEASQVTIRGLAEATARIGDVVGLINNIAGQTNLLALNATIEAARAGDAGKGFAVVASEVKALAAQTARATAEITSQVDTVRGATEATVKAMSEICDMIGGMSAASTSMAAAVEEQSVTTREIATSVQAVSGATAQSARAMGQVVLVADQAGSASKEVLTGAAGIGHETGILRAEVTRFLAAKRTG